MIKWLAALAFGLWAAPALAAAPPTPLFASDQPIRITIRGPIAELASKRADRPQSGTLSVSGTAESHPIRLAPRGITRRLSETCGFPPLRVDFPQAPPAGTLFERQRRLKLVTHCRPASDFQQKVLLEYAAYRLYNLLTPLSFRARLAYVDYVNADGKPYVSRVGFFIEDIDDVAARNGMIKPRTPDRVPLAQIDPRGGARFALFNYMIGNLDWSMRAGPAGEGCCHNSRLLARPEAPSGPLTPVPYDFDYSGLVDAPYAIPPEVFRIRSVRQRLYRGYCAHGAEARTVATEMVARRGELLGVLSAIPGLGVGTMARAAGYLEGFFADVGSGKLFASCVG